MAFVPEFLFASFGSKESRDMLHESFYELRAILAFPNPMDISFDISDIDCATSSFFKEPQNQGANKCRANLTR
jgi:hypothetical protein|tara:strand:+ start:70 stop:288 length:219 start_codon:yes stop_codon:yes gene_type:complete